MEAGLETILVLSGVTQPSDVERYPYRPSRVVTSVADLLDEI
jgi:5'-nucleotidase